MKIHESIATAAPEILVPSSAVEKDKWAVVACDQYTSEPEYWERVEKYVGSAPSTLNLVLPEVYLPRISEEQKEERLKAIKDSIDEYMKTGIFEELPEGFILTDRKTSLHESRKGLILAVDLEQYSFTPGNKELIRATEGTVLERIPPRVKIRANASIELPHIMLLIDDPEGSVIEAAYDAVKDTAPLYETDLMENSGSIKGYQIKADSETGKNIISALEGLKAKSSDGLLYLVGDGNHSLASAKAHWDNVKKNLSPEEQKTSVARYALAEVVNIHDKGLDFEPIHRVIFDIKPDEFLKKLSVFLEGRGMTVSDTPKAGAQSFEIVGLPSKTIVSVDNPPHSLAVGTVQLFLDSLGREVDYIHGDDTVRNLTGDKNTGVLLPAISKSTFFETISKEGVFPRKTFSMGEAFEKRFYFEAKKIED